MKEFTLPLERFGKRVMNLDELEEACRNRRSVITKHSHRANPAAWAIHHPGALLLILFREGLYLYEKPTKKLPTKKTEESNYRELEVGEAFGWDDQIQREDGTWVGTNRTGSNVPKVGHCYRRRK